MNAKVLLILAVVAAAYADKPQPQTGYGVPDSRSFEDSFEDAKYEFEWSVKDDSSGNDFGQQEARDGDNTRGSYYVQLPDGRLQKVQYFVDGDSGYQAEVNYEGEARYPDSRSRESQSRESYGPPRPTYSAP
ncbi:pro-resilin-like [Eriocheir sinensis]|uniref:pro-resilin-like n=1 Tax=Eriocheir sinensis TaxID=95602 RepID=UPI0021C81105|nr:pro-resilin-like [Eriocheir sinensis]